MSVTITALRQAALGLACVTALGACSNARDSQVTPFSIAKSALTSQKQPSMPSAAQISNDVTKALAATDASLILLTVPNRKAVTVMQQLEQNGGYATYGTGDRRSVTLRGGMMTGTRGLGNDLMSSDVGPVRALVAARRSGTAQREMRYLDGEDLTQIGLFTCSVQVGAQERLRTGENETSVTDVTETCDGTTENFTNTYKVAQTGHIIQSRQWHSPLNEYLSIQSLR